MEERQAIRRKVWTLKQSNSTNTTQFTTLNSTLGFLEQLFKTSGCLIKLCDTLIDGPVLRKKKKKESISSKLVSIVSCHTTILAKYYDNVCKHECTPCFLQDAHHNSPKSGTALPKNGQDINEDVIRTLVALTEIG